MSLFVFLSLSLAVAERLPVDDAAFEERLVGVSLGDEARGEPPRTPAP